MPEPNATPPPSAATVPLPDWVPPDDIGVQLTPSSARIDVVRVQQRPRALALKLLTGRSGPVIADRRDRTLCWLIPPGAAAGWLLPVKVYGPGRYVAVPAATPGAGRPVHWLVPPRGDCLTDPDALRDALEAALADLLAGGLRA